MGLVAIMVGIFMSGATTAFVFLFGNLFAAGPIPMAVMFLIGTFMMPVAIRAFWRVTEIFPEDREKFGMLVPIPLLFVSVLIIFSQPMLLRDLSMDGIRVMAAWLMWVCACGFASASQGMKKDEV